MREPSRNANSENRKVFVDEATIQQMAGVIAEASGAIKVILFRSAARLLGVVLAPSKYPVLEITASEAEVTIQVPRVPRAYARAKLGLDVT